MAFAPMLAPTFYGHVASTQDALLLFEACLSSAINHVARRPLGQERASLIKSGNVFIYEECSTGIRRWTDGVLWSPSRILGNFLVYRELERPFPPGEKKRAKKRNKGSPGTSKASELYGCLRSGISNGYHAPSASPSLASANSNSLNKETARSLIGSLVDSYEFKEEGLVKKTVSVTVGGVSHHLVSYYTVADIMNKKFSTPTIDPRFQNITPRTKLITGQNFRISIDEENLDRIDDELFYNAYPYARNSYKMTNQSISDHIMALSTPSITHWQTSSINDTMASNSAYSDGTSTDGAHFAPSAVVHAAPKTENYDTGVLLGTQFLDKKRNNLCSGTEVEEECKVGRA